MKVLVLSVLLLLPFTDITAQKKVIDSLNQELRKTGSDTNRVLVLGELVRNYYLFKPDTAILLAQEAYDLSQKLHFRRGEALSLNRIAVCYSALGDYAKALLLFTKSLAISQEINDTEGISRSYNNIGDTYLTQRDFKKALTYFIKAQSIQPAGLSPYIKAIFQLNIGECYLWLHQYDSASLYLRRTYDEVKAQNFSDLYGDFERNLGEVEAAQNHVAAALAYLHQGVLSSTTVEDMQNVSKAYKNIALLYQKQHQADSAVRYAKKALEAAQTGSYNQGIFETSSLLTTLYENRDNEAAFQYLKLATAAKDSLYSQEKVKQILSISFEEKQREQELAAARSESRNQLRLAALLGVLVVILLLAIILYRNNRQKQQANTLLQQQKKEIEDTLAELKATQKQLVQSEKMASLGELTSGIAHEIQNPLNFVNNFSDVNAELIDDLKEELRAGHTTEALALADDIQSNELKIKTHGKRADAIVKGMLQHARTGTGQKELTDINGMIDEYLRLSYYGLRAKNKALDAAIETDFDQSLGKIKVVPQEIGRVLLNLFNNAFYTVNEKKKTMNGAYMPTVMVSTKMLNDKIEIMVRDNGMGISKSVHEKIFQSFFTTKPTGQGTGLGLSLSYDIVKAHGGELIVESTEDVGSVFSIQLPRV